MPSIIQADQLKPADGVTTYLNSGTLSNLTFPAGHVLQVVQAVKTDVQNVTSSSSAVNWTTVTNLEPSITPSATSSKILVNISISHSSETYSNLVKLQAKTGSGSFADLTGAIGPASGSKSRITLSGVGGSLDQGEISTNSMMYLDSPSTTSARSYQIQFTHRHLGTGVINKSYEDADADYAGRGISTITLMEIAG